MSIVHKWGVVDEIFFAIIMPFKPLKTGLIFENVLGLLFKVLFV